MEQRHVDESRSIRRDPDNQNIVDRAVTEAEEFLTPVLKYNHEVRDQITNFVEILALSKFGQNAVLSNNAHQTVISDILSHVTNIHQALLQYQVATAGTSDHDESGLELSSLPVIYGLVDLLLIEGVYPKLSPGVGFPYLCRTRSLIYRNVAESYRTLKDLNMCHRITNELGRIFDDLKQGLEPFLVQQYLPDFVAASAQLAFASNTEGAAAAHERTVFNIRLNRMPTSLILQTLTALNQTDAPGWLKAVLAEHLGMVPLRNGGVRETISFIASMFSEEWQHSGTGKIPLEAVSQIGKLLSSKPATISEDEYFNKLAPQLLDLLEGQAGDEMARVASIVIGSRILGRRAWGAPGNIGWKWFVEPIHKALNPPQSKNKNLIREEDLHRSLRRLSRLVASHPNPGLVGRLVSPVLLPLWALLNYALDRKLRETWAVPTQELLKAYLKLAGGAPQLKALADNLMFDGPTYWEFAPGDEGGVEIRPREASDKLSNPLDFISHIDQRVDCFVSLIKGSSMTDISIADTVLEVLKKSLLQHSHPDIELASEGRKTSSDPMDILVLQKLASDMLLSFQEQISRQPNAMLRLVQQQIDQRVKAVESARQHQENLRKPSYKSLGNIVTPAASGVDESAVDEDIERLQTMLSLIALLLRDSGNISTETREILKDIRSSLTKLRSMSMPATLQEMIDAILALVDDQRPSMNQSISPEDSTKATSGSASTEHAFLSLIQEDLASPSPPIRAEALASLAKFIASGPSVLNVPAITLLLLHTIETDEEEFVYLAAMKALCEFARRAGPRIVVSSGLNAFKDEDQKLNVDERLKVGEALSQLVESLAENTPTAFEMEKLEATRRVAKSMLVIASRRGERNPSSHSIAEFSEPRSREDEMIAKTIRGWSSTGREEDVRIRTSALSTLGKGLSTSMSSVSDADILAAIDVSLAILALEPGPEKAILRRAAVLIFLSVLQGLDVVPGETQNSKVKPASEPALDAHKWAEVERILRWATDVDEDEIVRSHASAVLESLEAWRMQNVLRASGIVSEAGDDLRLPDDGLQGGLRGLSVNSRVTDGGGLKVEEIE